MEVEAVDAVGAGGENGGEETFEAGDVAEGNRDRFVDSVVVDEVAFVRVSFLVDRADFDEVGLDVGGGDGFGGRSFEDGGDGLIVEGFGDGEGRVAGLDADGDNDAIGDDFNYGVAGDVNPIVVALGGGGRTPKRRRSRIGTASWIMIGRYAYCDSFRFDIGGHLGRRA